MKPLLRGYSHQAAFFLSLAACALLIHKSHGTLTLTSIIIYSISLCGLYAVSTIYHCPFWKDHSTYRLIGRIDHAAIFVLIAGTGTPICLIGLKGEPGWELLVITWIIALFGIVLALFNTYRPKWIRAALYTATGWMVVPFIPEIKIALGPQNFTLLLSGGVIYTLGAIIYAVKKPNPFPHIFGYHEIFHLFVIAASFLHFMVIYNLVIHQ